MTAAATERPEDTAGYLAHTTARSTGTLVILCDSAAQGIDPADGGRYLLICAGTSEELHGGSLNCERRRDADGSMRHPETWCPYCQEDALPDDPVLRIER